MVICFETVLSQVCFCVVWEGTGRIEGCDGGDSWLEWGREGAERLGRETGQRDTYINKEEGNVTLFSAVVHVSVIFVLVRNFSPHFHKCYT